MSEKDLATSDNREPGYLLIHNETDMRTYLSKHPDECFDVAKNFPDYRTLAIEIDWRALSVIPKRLQTVEQVTTALMQSGYALEVASESILKRNPHLYALAVKSDGMALKYVPEEYRTVDNCKDAVRNNGFALHLVPILCRTTEVCEIAIENDPRAIRYAVQYSDEVLFSAVRRNGMLLGAVSKRRRTLAVCEAAVSNSPLALQFVPEECRTKDMESDAVRRDWRAIEYCKNRTKKLLLAAFSQSPLAIKYFPDKWKSTQICLDAFHRDPMTIYFLTTDVLDEDVIVTWLDFVINSHTDRFSSARLNNEGFAVLVKLDRKIICCNRVRHRLRKLKIANITRAEWSIQSNCFVIDEVITLPSVGEEQLQEVHYSSRPTCLDELIDTMCGDLAPVTFDGYAFDDYDEARHDLSTAHLSADSLVLIGAYDDSDYCRLIKAGSECIDFRPATPSGVIGPVTSDNTDYEWLNRPKPIIYISDLHLDYKLAEDFPVRATLEEIEGRITDIANTIASCIEQACCCKAVDPILIVLGDVSYNFDVCDIFYKALHKAVRGTIIVVLGNHEYWDVTDSTILPDSKARVQSIDRKYDQMLKSNQCILLQSGIYIKHNGFSDIALTNEDIDRIDDTTLAAFIEHSSLVIIGGTGFTGESADHNAENGLYRNALVDVAEDRVLSKKMAMLHERIRRIAPKISVIVATHMPMRCWSKEAFQPGWTYLSGHTHNNRSQEVNDALVLEDAQVGYDGRNFTPRVLYREGGCDPFQALEDGVYEVTKEDYIFFYYHQRVLIKEMKRRGRIYLLKREGIYLFLFQWEKTGRLYLLEGAGIRKVEKQSISYYFEHMLAYSKLIKEEFSTYHNAISQISAEVKLFGGSGTVHGTIVDIDFLDHITLDPLSGTMRFYSAPSVLSRVYYPNLQELLEQRAPQLLERYRALLENRAGTSLATTSDSTHAIARAEYGYDQYLYRPSRIMRSIQYLFDINVIRNWNETVIRQYADFTDADSHNEPQTYRLKTRELIMGSEHSASHTQRKELSLSDPENMKHVSRAYPGSFLSLGVEDEVAETIRTWRLKHEFVGIQQCSMSLNLPMHIVMFWWYRV